MCAARASRHRIIVIIILQHRTRHHGSIPGNRVPGSHAWRTAVSCRDGSGGLAVPRTVQQAKDLDGITSVSRALNITLPQHILITKMLARRVCADCGKGYNVADINEGDYVMPPLLPKPSDCTKCVGKPRLVVREDDKEAIVRERFVVYETQTAPLIQYYTAQKKLQNFDVKRGLDDTPRLFEDLGIKE